ncbi:hypothetical protein [Methanobrevibacter sp.]|uniref:hypothetical protein n=1 Tax=Methanobrevibacter sp. TaxID=66852 RepID=UPI002615956B|nr:hypothetical protein [uncultured Methanobrevibacter sp.]
MKKWLKKWYVLLIYSVVIILFIILNICFSINDEKFDFNNIISLLVGLMALWGVIYTSMSNKDNLLLQIENSNNQLKFQFNSENKLKALISLKNLLSELLSTKQSDLLGGISSTSKNTVWFKEKRPFYLHYLPTKIRYKINKINDKVGTEYWCSEDYYADIKALCIYTNEKIEEMVDLKKIK